MNYRINPKTHTLKIARFKSRKINSPDSDTHRIKFQHLPNMFPTQYLPLKEKEPG